MSYKQNNFRGRLVEKYVAVASYLVAVIFAFASLYLAEAHDVAAGNCSVVARFLLLTATLFCMDYLLKSHESSTPRDP